MSIELQPKSLRSIDKIVSENTDGGLLISDIAALKQRFQPDIQSNLQTKEIKLSDLGVFPLPDETKTLLRESLSFDGKVMHIPEILLRSQIPVFFDGKNAAYIPAAVIGICRYFDEMWHETNEQEMLVSVLRGFSLLAAFAGI